MAGARATSARVHLNVVSRACVHTRPGVSVRRLPLVVSASRPTAPRDHSTNTRNASYTLSSGSPALPETDVLREPWVEE